MTAIQQRTSFVEANPTHASLRSDLRSVALDLLIATAMIMIPPRLRWSRRSSTLLKIAGVTLAVTQFVPVSTAGSLTRLLSRLTRNSTGLVGLSLIAGQYQLTEEESTVRGAIAALGGTLLILSAIRRKLDRSSRLGD